MAKNNGKSSEHLFETFLDSLGKQAFYYRIPDAAEVRGRTGRIGYTRPAPSDYVVTLDGVTSYSEVKSTKDKTAFRFSLLRKDQSAMARQVLSAGGEYLVYLHALGFNRWYRIPYQVIQSVKDEGVASIPWTNLEDFVWNP